MVGEILRVGADAEETIGQRVGYVLGDVARMAASWAQIGTLGTWLDIKVGLDVTLICN